MLRTLRMLPLFSVALVAGAGMLGRAAPIAHAAGNATTTAVTCSPSTITATQNTTCTATVTDVSNSPTAPAGQVTWTDNQLGPAQARFSPSNANPPYCTLVATGSNSAACQTPETFSVYFPSGAVTITGSYGGDAAHAASGNSLPVTVQFTTQYDWSSSSLGNFETAAGPNNTLWYPDGYESIKVVDLSGSLSSPAITTVAVNNNCPAGSGCGPAGITLGPDGNMWFTELYARRIGRIDPTAHTVTEYQLPYISGWDPRYITTGPDGKGGQALWFTVEDGGQGGSSPYLCSGGVCSVGLGEIDTGGNLVQAVLVNYVTNGLAVTSGPGPNGSNGSLWFTVNGQFQEQVLRYDPPASPPSTLCVVNYTGSQSSATSIPCAFPSAAYGLPSGMGNNLWGITTGSDGDVWFLDDTATGSDGKQGSALGQVTQTSATTTIGKNSSGDYTWTPIGGAITQYGPTLSPGCRLNNGVTALATAGDGNLWIAGQTFVTGTSFYATATEFSPSAADAGNALNGNCYIPGAFIPNASLGSLNTSWVVPGAPDSNLVWLTTGAGAIKVSLAAGTDVPVVNVPNPGPMVEATGPSGATVTFSVTATDPDGGSAPAATCTPASGSVFPTGQTTVNCSATDADGTGQTGAGSFVVTVQDTTPPSVNVGFPAPPSNQNGWYNATPGQVPVAGTVTAVDAVAVASVTCLDGSATLSPAWSTPPGPGVTSAAGALSISGDGTHTIQCTATDEANNSAGASATVKIDTTPPAITISAPASGATYQLHQSIEASYTCTDGGAGIASCVGPVGNGANITTDSGGPQTFTVNATDNAGNPHSASVTYTVQTNTPPTASAGGPYAGTEGVPVSLSGSALDGDGDTVTSQWTETPGTGTGACAFANAAALSTTVTCSDEGTYTLTLAATDGAGLQNLTPAQATLTISDSTPAVSPIGATPTAPIAVNTTLSPSTTFTDAGSAADGESYTATWDWGDGTTSPGAVTPPSGTTPGSVSGSHAYSAAGSYTVSLALADDDNQSAAVQASPIRVNAPPTVSAGGPYTGTEGAAVQLSGTASDNDGDSMAPYQWTAAPATGAGAGTGTCTITSASTPPAAPAATITCSDEGTYTIALTATDSAGFSAKATATLTVGDSLPSVTGVTVPVIPAAVNTTVPVSGTFTDTGSAASGESYTATWDWGDGTSSNPDKGAGTVTPPAGANAGSVSGAHTYTAAGVYTVTLTVTDDDGTNGAAFASTEYVVVYDPSAGFVTGDGWIGSQPGSCVAVDAPSGACGNTGTTGKANFGFVAKYEHGATVPSGNTEFQFQTGNLNFHSTSYTFLVVQGTSGMAQYQGAGTINGQAGYTFTLTAYDHDLNSACGSVDGFRIQITNAGGGIVYDNMLPLAGPGNTIDCHNTQPLGGGDIVIHST